MTNPNNNDLNARTNLCNFFRTAANGFHSAATNPRKRKALIVLLLLAALLCAVIYCRAIFLRRSIASCSLLH